MSWKEIEVTSVSDLREGDRVNGMPVVWTDDELGFGMDDGDKGQRKTCEWFYGYLAGGGKVERLVDEGPQANLGLATTGELLAELTARCETNGTIHYRTVDGFDHLRSNLTATEIAAYIVKDGGE
jgi:hypothetical protein